MEYMKLNPGEADKYDEYWAEASRGEEQVSGTDARAVLSRAAKVSKTQLRLIWEIADHRHEGVLDRSQFLIALRLIALAQRGAEISVKGLRNFVGINLVPSIAPAPAPPTAAAGVCSNSSGAPSSSADPSSAQPQSGLVWTVGTDVLARYDSFFESLNANGSGFVDGSAGVAFFGKSGLPRPTLKRVWQLADVTRDGKLDREEFRAAMHMVAGLRAGRVSVIDLPQALHRCGPFWLRSESEASSMQQPPRAQPKLVPQPELEHVAPPLGTVAAPSIAMEQNDLASSTARSPRLPVAQDGDLLGGAVRMHAAKMSPSFAPPSPQFGRRENADDTGTLREKLRLEQHEALRAQRELEMMRAEMKQLRLEKAKVHAVPEPQGESEVEQMRQAYQQMVEAKARAEEEAAMARLEAARLKQESSRSAASRAATVTSPKGLASSRGSFDSEDNLRKKGLPSSSTSKDGAFIATSSSSPASPLKSPRRHQTPLAAAAVQSPVVSPDASFLTATKPSPARRSKGPSTGAARPSRLISDDSMSESDDDDFWGSSGAGSKPTLGNAANTADTSQGASGFGNDLDEWAF
jgi:hypothetical protein